MRVSKFHLSTQKEAPAEADVVSQKLMLRAGLIKKLGSETQKVLTHGKLPVIVVR